MLAPQMRLGSLNVGFICRQQIPAVMVCEQQGWGRGSGAEPVPRAGAVGLDPPDHPVATAAPHTMLCPSSQPE